MYNPVNIKILMVKKGVNAQDLSVRTGLSLPTIYSVLRGADVKTSTLELVAKALESSELAFYLTDSESKLSGIEVPDDQPPAA